MQYTPPPPSQKNTSCGMVIGGIFSSAHYMGSCQDRNNLKNFVHCTCTLYIVQCTSATNWATIHPWLATTQPCLTVIIIFVQYYKGKPCRPSGFPVRIWSWFGFHPASWGRTRDQSVTLPPEILQKIILYSRKEGKSFHSYNPFFRQNAVENSFSIYSLVILLNRVEMCK